MNHLQIVILAAGHGTRMLSDLPKILHPLGGRPALHYVLDLAHQMTPAEVVLVVSPALKDLKTPFTHKITIQDPAQGTGDAVKFALPHLKPQGHVMVLFGDTPLIQKKTLDNMLKLAERKPEKAVILLGMCPRDKQNYARLILNDTGDLEEVIEFKDLKVEHKDIALCNSGVALIRADLLESLLCEITPHNAAGEYYLTDIVKIARGKGFTCGVVEGAADEFMGINTREDLSHAEAILQNRWRKQIMAEGVTLIDPQTTYLSFDTKIQNDVTIHPCVVIGPGVTIEKGAEILSFSKLSDAHLGPKAIVGPFAHLRGGVHLHEAAEIGNFVEVKKSTFGPKAKAKHLSYIGDSEVGAKSNIGAGTITCNYDGYKKSKTLIGSGVFIGSNSSLVAPVSIGDNAIVGAGSVVTQNVESGNLALARSAQTTIEKGADKFREKRKAGKDL
jgi:bifunctional UDP-N-acetylglucosamine pyrophosphorylase/glucosamine-1-phosphate N-acetyltransferase